MMIDIKQPKELESSLQELLKTHCVFDVWVRQPWEPVQTEPIAIRSGAIKVVLVVSAGLASSVAIEGSPDGGQTWQSLHKGPSIMGLVVLTYEPDQGQQQQQRLTHFRVRASRLNKGAVKVALWPSPPVS